MKNTLPIKTTMYYLHRKNGILDTKFLLGNSYFIQQIVKPLHTTIKNWSKEGRKGDSSVQDFIDNHLQTIGISTLTIFVPQTNNNNKGIKLYQKASKEEYAKFLHGNFEGNNSSHRVTTKIDHADQYIKLQAKAVSISFFQSSIYLFLILKH